MNITLKDVAEAGHAPVLPMWEGFDRKDWTDAERAAFEAGKKAATDAIVVMLLGMFRGSIGLRDEDPAP